MRLFNVFREIEYEGLTYLATVAGNAPADAVAYYARTEGASRGVVRAQFQRDGADVYVDHAGEIIAEPLRIL